jgi:hypothetical protein
MTASSPGKGVAPFPPKSPLGSLPRVRNPEVMKFLIMPQYLGLCLTGTRGSDRPPQGVLKLFAGGRAWRPASTIYSLSELPAFLSSLVAAATMTATHSGRRFRLFLPLLVPFLAPWMVMIDGTAWLLLGTTSLPPGARCGPTASSLVANWAVMSSSSSLVYLVMLFSAWKHGGCYASRTPLPGAFGPNLLGPRLCLSWSPCPPWRRFCTWC